MTARVAAVVCGDLQVVVVIDMARLARNRCMPAGERKADGRCGVVPSERRPEPGVERSVATLAIRRSEHSRIGRMRRIARVLPIFRVARLAVR